MRMMVENLPKLLDQMEFTNRLHDSTFNKIKYETNEEVFIALL